MQSAYAVAFYIGKLTALKGLDARLKEIRSYLDLVIDGKLPLNHEILYHLQVCFS
jgi:26S proteasome regulatory subunit N8